jgi:hypothetical protein
MELDGVQWLTRALTDPASFRRTLADFLGVCARGTRHFAANGRSVDLSKVHEVTLEIRLSEREQDVDGVEGHELMTSSPEFSIKPGRTNTKREAIRKIKNGVHDDPSKTPVKIHLPPSRRKVVDPRGDAQSTLDMAHTKSRVRLRGERHFEGVNSAETPTSRVELIQILDLGREGLST